LGGKVPAERLRVIAQHPVAVAFDVDPVEVVAKRADGHVRAPLVPQYEAVRVEDVPIARPTGAVAPRPRAFPEVSEDRSRGLSTQRTHCGGDLPALQVRVAWADVEATVAPQDALLWHRIGQILGGSMEVNVMLSGNANLVDLNLPIFDPAYIRTIVAMCWAWFRRLTPPRLSP
jgi:hypothetical protein